MILSQNDALLLALRCPLFPCSPTAPTLLSLHYGLTPRSYSSRLPTKNCVFYRFSAWKWDPRIPNVVSVFFSHPTINLSNARVHDVTHHHRRPYRHMSSMTELLHRTENCFVSRAAILTMPLTVPSIMYNGTRMSCQSGIGSCVHRVGDSTDS